MLTIRKSQDRGLAEHGWLKSFHSFSFADYYDPKHMGFRDLRVINEDWIQPGEGFGTHGHKDMEIISYVVQGELAHKDSMGNGSSIKPGEIQYMSAGSGVTHSEFNHSNTETTHLLQIWILPNNKDLKPRYDQKKIDSSKATNQFYLLASGKNNSALITISQDVDLLLSLLERGQSLNYQIKPGRALWLQMVKGELDANGKNLQVGDALSLEDEKTLNLVAKINCELLLFDLN